MDSGNINVYHLLCIYDLEDLKSLSYVGIMTDWQTDCHYSGFLSGKTETR